jgi:D-alanyl-D-alanine carboxypeptidase
MRVRLLIVGCCLLLPLGAGPARAGLEDLPTFTDEELVQLVEAAGTANVLPPGDPIAITGDADFDDEIRARAEARGYRRRPTPVGPLMEVDGQLLQPPVVAAWRALKAAAAGAGYRIRIVSGYRSEAAQVSTFLSGVDGSSLEDYEERMAWSAPPGYSKHHTGYVIDLALPGQSHNDFARSGAYRWLVADNYLVLKSFGFLPSYPPNGPPQGPNPEAWEYAYVGGWVFRCYRELLWGPQAIGLGGPPDCPD